MTSHEELRRISKECRSHAEVIIARITADMLDKHVDILDLETVQFTIHQPQISAVAVTTDSPERTEGRQFLRHFHITDIPCVPYLVAGFEVVQVFLIPIAVCITQNANPLHRSNRLRINAAMIFSVSTSPNTLESMQRS